MSQLIVDSAERTSTLVELLRWRAAYQLDRHLYTFLTDGENEKAHLSAAELDRRARAIGARLQQLGAAGQRVLLVFPPGLDYISAFFGCLYAGAIAVPALPPEPNKPVPRLVSIAADAQATIALSTTRILTSSDRRLAMAFDSLVIRWLAVDTISPIVADQWRDPALTSNTLAVLQYTSGSTASPRGVMLTHHNLLSNLALIRRSFESTSESHGVLWLPPYHDMGLIGGLLWPLYEGARITLMSPLHFLQRPLRWLQAISRDGSDFSGAPTFAYDLCARKITPEQRATLDLSRWEVAFVGAEPVRHETLDRFAAAFKECGFRREAFYPCYGLAEATLFAAGGSRASEPIVRTVQAAALEGGEIRPPTDGELTRTLVGCGTSVASQRMLIVDPESSLKLASGRVGEIWIAGPSVAQGYWNHRDETERTFHAYLADTGEGPFLRTGDLGFLDGDELFVTGRLKDLIIVDGRNHYPQDIELTVEQSHPALRPGSCAAFSVDLEGTERLIVATELNPRFQPFDRRTPIDRKAVVEAIRRAVSESHGLRVFDVLLLKLGAIPVTSSGKIQRHACRAGYLAGSLDAPGELVGIP
jgi:acyl-CoA synthetase (AMP-forming)/AMP-acid ligase II